MIITKTPLRITFAGGGSDMASYYMKHPSTCISATINKYVYVLVRKRFDDKIYLKYSDNEVVDVRHIDDIRHDFIRETLKFMSVTKTIVGIIHLYQKLISPILPPSCMHQTSCSNYTINSIKSFGPFLGIFWGVSRIISCNPWNKKIIEKI